VLPLPGLRDTFAGYLERILGALGDRVGFSLGDHGKHPDREVVGLWHVAANELHPAVPESEGERSRAREPVQLGDVLRALERLYGQAGALQANRTLEIRTGKRTKNQWLELNGDVATSFAVRYRGLPTLMGDKVKWDTSHLFEYEALLEAASKRKG
jgi:hypothetical protein